MGLGGGCFETLIPEICVLDTCCRFSESIIIIMS